MTLNEMIDVLEAKKRGEIIQRQWKCCIVPWSDDDDPLWNFEQCNYRVKPKPREWWINEYESGSGLDRYATKAEATARAAPGRLRCVHVIEVID